VYDAWNRLVSTSDGTNTVTYQYDGTGRLIERTTGGVTEHDYYSGQQVVQVYTYSSGTFQGGQQYIWSPLYVDTPILRDTYDANGDLVSSDRLYYTTDANHNVTAVTNSSGMVHERYAYTAFGVVTVYDPSWANPSQTSSVGNTRLFAGMDMDPLTGAYYDNARWYNPINGTFLGRDPIAADINLYRYVFNNPAIYVDSTGNGIVGPWFDPNKPRYQAPGPGPIILLPPVNGPVTLLPPVNGPITLLPPVNGPVTRLPPVNPPSGPGPSYTPPSYNPPNYGPGSPDENKPLIIPPSLLQPPDDQYPLPDWLKPLKRYLPVAPPVAPPGTWTPPSGRPNPDNDGGKGPSVPKHFIPIPGMVPPGCEIHIGPENPLDPFGPWGGDIGGEWHY
jgi:RHS repeat-associated protein